jgi:hypothetical protein
MATKELTPQELANQQLKDLQYKQQTGNTGKVAANLNEEYEINDYDQDYVHVLIENKTFNQAKNDMDVSQVVRTFHPNVFEQVKGQLGGTSQTIIHDPRAKKAQKAESEEETKTANKK